MRKFHAALLGISTVSLILACKSATPALSDGHDDAGSGSGDGGGVVKDGGHAPVDGGGSAPDAGKGPTNDAAGSGGDGGGHVGSDAGLEGGTHAGSDASGSDAGSHGGSDGGLPPAVLTFLSYIATIQNGGTIPASGARPAITVTVNGDGSRTASVVGKTAIPRLLLTWTNNQSFTMSQDINGDGIVDDQNTVTTTNGTTTGLWQLDQNESGFYNWQLSTTETANALIATVDELPPLSSTWLTMSSYGSDPVDYGGPLCVPVQNGADNTCDSFTLPSKANFCVSPTNPVANVPQCSQGTTSACVTLIPDGSTWTIASVSPNALVSPPVAAHSLFFIMTEGPYACTPSQSSQIEEALVAAMNGDFDSISSINMGRWLQVMFGLATQPLFYGCGLPSSVPAGTAALSLPAEFLDDSTGASWVTTTNTGAFAGQTLPGGAGGPDTIEEILIHEWFHVAGSHHPHDPGGDDARDYIYSCSRVATAGRAFQNGFYLGVCCDASSARDFATCADEDNKAQFGVQSIFKEYATGVAESIQSGLTSYTNEPAGNTCFTSGGPTVTPCMCWVEQTPTYCDQVPVTEQNALTQFGQSGAIETLTEPNCCESCDPSTPYEPAPCGIVSTTTPALCPPLAGCGVLPTTGGYAPGPTPNLENPAAALRQSEATAISLAMTINCPPVAGFAY